MGIPGPEPLADRTLGKQGYIRSGGVRQPICTLSTMFTYLLTYLDNLHSSGAV